ncbi:predicted protein [Naegleria gruberi]|uniref:Predicted protein n=1 Tax=Naegleria gruberi TaxID=5762 RepID=D2VRY5_NAEGR|nr:uncharacterized protein NAEGRDRAFT_71748 [Naegleria gruberi]EFC40544.1 predicted protein [Naegleria gruberi]|eukprot:XP_002673288.1 predicted protein [Naegleria gruberi strain NEG-M]
MIIATDYLPNLVREDRYWFGIDFGNSFIKVSSDICSGCLGENVIRLGSNVDTVIVCMMESKIKRFELFGFEESDEEYIDFTIVNIKRLIDCLGSDQDQLNEIKILENDEIEGEKRLISQIFTENVHIKSKDDVENLNKLIQIKITDTKTNYSIEIPLFTLMVKLFDKLRVEILGKDMGKDLFERNIITVPVFYNDLQLTFLKSAFEMAGFKVERAIKDVIAAGLAYSINNKTDRDLLILNCGSTCTIATLYNLEEGIFELIEYTSDSTISGNSIDELLVNYCVQEFKKKTKKQLTNPKARARLYEVCKLAKEELYGERNLLNVLIQVDSLMDGVDFSLVLSKPKFEQLVTPVVSKITSLLNSLLERNSKSIHSVSDLILCGACCQISKFSSTIREFFKGNNQFVLYDNIPPKTIKARGATVFCEQFRVRNTFWAHVVLPLSIGIEHNRKMMILAHRNTYLPYKKSFTVQKNVNPSTNQFHFKLYMGERYIPRNNLLLGEFCIPNLNETSDKTVLREFKLDVSISYEEILFLTIQEATSIQEYHFEADWTQLTRELVEESARLGELDKSS